MDHGFEGKRALVTGAGSGIGRAIAEALAREGATVALHDRDAERTAEVRQIIEKAGGGAISVAADLRNSAKISAMRAETLKRLGGIDIIVNNAGWAESNMARAAIRKSAERRGEDFDSAHARTMRANMLGAPMGPESPADMAIYPAVRHGRYFAGQAINVCGGVNYH